MASMSKKISKFADKSGLRVPVTVADSSHQSGGSFLTENL